MTPRMQAILDLFADGDTMTKGEAIARVGRRGDPDNLAAFRALRGVYISRVDRDARPIRYALKALVPAPVSRAGVVKHAVATQPCSVFAMARRPVKLRPSAFAGRA